MVSGEGPHSNKWKNVLENLNAMGPQSRSIQSGVWPLCLFNVGDYPEIKQLSLASKILFRLFGGNAVN